MDITKDPKTLEFMQHYAVGMYKADAIVDAHRTEGV